ncbi:MAG: lamin tail domain-containing protein [Bacteroidota bacterium]
MISFYKRFSLITLLVFTGIAPNLFGQQTILQESFTDGDYTSNPTWISSDRYTGDSNPDFIIDGHVLRLNGDPDNGGEAYITVERTMNTGTWEALINFDFNPSSTSLVRYYLFADQQDLSGPLNGYFIKIGDTEDEISLYRQTGTDVTEIIDGTDDRIDAASVTVRVQAKRNSDGTWELYSDPTGGTNFTAEHTQPVADHSHHVARYSGFWAKYIGSRSTLYTFDEITHTQSPTQITGVERGGDDQTLTITFSDTLDTGSLATTSFSVDQELGAPQSIQSNGYRQVDISYNSVIPSAAYTLTTTGITDRYGNALASTTFDFELIFDTPGPGDILINEYMSDPPSGYAEYVEVYNPTNKRFNISGWTFSDDANPTTLPSDTLRLDPGGYLLLSGDTTSLFNVFGSRPYVDVSSFPSLNNAGDAIVLRTPTGTTIDSLTYDSGWGGTDIAVERRSTEAPSTLAANWADSPNNLLGTPGLANEVEADQTAPQLTDFSYSSNTAIQLIFDEALDQTSVETISNYSFSPTRSISAVSFATPDTVTLTLNDPLQNGTSYTLSLTQIEDLFGNAATIDTSFVYYDLVEADSGDVVINEFLYDTPTGYAEYIELYNPTDNRYDLNGWQVDDENQSPVQLSDHTQWLDPDSYLVLSSDTASLNAVFGSREYVQVSGLPNLNNDKDAIVVRNAQGTTIDSLFYSDNWGGSKVALERRSSSVAGLWAANWSNSPDPLLGTPGLPNQVPADESAASLSSVTYQSDTQLTVVFDEPIASETAQNSSHYSLTPDRAIASAVYQAPDTVRINLSDPLQSGTTYSLTIDQVEDLFGNTQVLNQGFTYWNVQPADSGDVVINEFIYDPPSGYSEFIELRNTTEKPVDVSRWTINDNRGFPRVALASEQLVLPPDSFLVIAPNTDLLASFPNANLQVQSGFPALNNSGDNIVLRDPQGAILDSLTYTTLWGGNGVSVERKSPTVSSAQPVNWGNHPGDDLASPGAVNLVATDTQPPTLQQVYAQDSRTIALQFSETISSDALSVSDLSIAPTIPVTTLRIDGPNVTVSLDSDLQSSTTYSITVQPPADLFGNRAEQSFSDAFTYYLTVEADSGDVFINEFLADPPDGWTEYIELKNATGSALDLSQWTIADNASSPTRIATTPVVVPADSFAVIAPDSTLFKAQGPFIIATMGSRFPSLNNSADAIQLADTSGTELDSLSYTSDWFEDTDQALERRTHQLSGIYLPNWGPNPSGVGSPGRANQVPLDQTPPHITSVLVRNARQVTLRFSELLDPSTATDQEHLSLEAPYDISLLAAQEDSLMLMLNQELPEAENVVLTVGGQTDLFGNALPDTSITLRYLNFEEASPFDVVINEILYRRAQAGSPEFIELYNRSDRNINLNNWVVSDIGRDAQLKRKGASNPLTILNTPVLEPGEYLVITDNDSFANTLQNGYAVSGFPSLNDDEETLVIRTPHHTTIDSVNYRSTWGGSQRGVSLERKDPSAPSNDPSNWQTSTSSTGYSAGEENPSYERDTQSPEVIFANRVGQIIRVQFSEFIDLTASTEFLVDGEALPIASFSNAQANRIQLDASSVPNDDQVTLSIQNLTDYSGNVTTTLDIPVAQPLQSGGVVINEIMYDPIADDNDNRDDQAEYLELANTTDYAISLEGIYLRDAADEDGDFNTLIPATSVAKWIPAGGYALIHASNIAAFDRTETAQYFDLTEERHTMRVDRSSLSLSSGNDSIFLVDSTGTTIDSVFYADSWHNPNLADTKGRSLERVQPDGQSNDPGNWGTSTAEKGGTPTAQNSLYQSSATPTATNDITLSPNPFSPDGDGNEDRLIINYTLEQTDYLLRVRIMDRYGRLVRELANGEPAGVNGTLYWDGRTDEGSSNRIGIYIILFEAYDSAQGKNKVIKETVVLARQL